MEQHRPTKRHPDGRRLSALSRRFEELLPATLDSFFSAADDFLFKLAEKSGADSADYFDQLRVLRRRKGELRSQILRDVDDWIKGGAQVIVEHEDNESTEDDFASLSLMDDIVLDRTLATDSFATRTIERSGDHWLAFHERMMALTCQKNLKDKETPFNPAALGTIVLKRIETMDCPFKTSLMLFRLFDDLAIPKLDLFYQNSNTWLIEEGILPNLKLIQGRSNNTPVNAQTIAQISADLAGVDTSTLPTGHTQLPMSGVAPVAGGLPGGSVAGGVPGGVLVDPNVWQQMLASMATIQAQPAPAPQQLDELKTWTSDQAKAVTQQAEGTIEAGTVSLVAMLFEYILDDENLSAHMKQLLARMQIPIIKVAMIDKDFFTDTDHSARLLLNRMARSATGWHADANIENDALLEGMESIVSKLNRDFEDDLSIFDALLDEFSNLLEGYKTQQSEQIDTIRESEEEEFAEHQKQDRARLFIDTLLEGADLPEQVRKVLDESWYTLMAGIFSKQGESKAWKTSARIARELLWTLQPSVQTTQTARFEQVVPKLLSGFADGLKAAKLDQSEIDATLEEIKNYHGVHQSELNEAYWDAQEKLDQFESQSEKAEQIVEEPMPLPVDEPVVQIKNADLSYYLDQVESLTVDQWFDIEQADGTMARGQLSVIIGEGSKYVFTDYTGEKIAERSAIGLAMGMRNDQFVMIAEDPLFDRMIDTLVDDLGSKSAS